MSQNSLISERFENVFPLGESSVQWTTTVLGFFLVLLSVFYYYKSKKRKALLKKLPGPKLNELVSNLVIFKAMFCNKSASLRSQFLQVICGYTEVFRKDGMWLFSGAGFRNILILCKAETVEAVLNSNDILSKGFEYDFLAPMLKEGLLTSKKKKWRKRRKLLTPSFHFRILDDFIPLFNEHAKVFASLLSSKMEKEPWIDIAPLSSLCTLDIICETAMGKKIHALENSDSPYVKALHEFCKTAVERIMSPWLWLDFIFYRTKSGKHFIETLKVMDDFTRQVIAERKAEMLQDPNSNEAQPGKKRLALLDLLLDLHLKDDNFTLEDVAEEVDNFMFAGHDTTSSGLSWALYMLGLHPEIQRKCQQEVDDVLGDDENIAITLDEIKALKYLDCVLKETRRLWPPTPFIARDLDEDAIIDGYLVPKGTSCGILIYMLHRDPDVFPNPQKFDPDRFLLENATGRHPYAYVPFSAGPRNCIGQRFAIFEAITVMATILRKFNVKSVDPLDKIHIVDDLVLRSEKGLRIIFELRDKDVNNSCENHVEYL